MTTANCTPFIGFPMIRNIYSYIHIDIFLAMIIASINLIHSFIRDKNQSDSFYNANYYTSIKIDLPMVVMMYPREGTKR